MRELAGSILAATILLPAIAVGDPAGMNRTAAEGGRDALRDQVNPAKIVGMLAIRAYRVILRPLLRGRCQFHPSCSRYASDAIASFGLINGTIMGAERLSRCHGYAILGGYPVRSGDGLLNDPAGGKPPPLPFLSWLGL